MTFFSSLCCYVTIASVVSNFPYDRNDRCDYMETRGCHQNGDGDAGTGTQGRVFGDAETRGDARTGTWGREIGDAGSGT